MLIVIIAAIIGFLAGVQTMLVLNRRLQKTSVKVIETKTEESYMDGFEAGCKSISESPLTVKMYYDKFFKYGHMKM